MSIHVADNRLEAALLEAGYNPHTEPVTPRRTYVRTWNAVETSDRPPTIPDPLPPTWAPGPNARTLLDLEAGQCRFPVGDESGVFQLFCGNEAHGHMDPPYCPECAQRILPRGASVNPKVLH